MRLVRPPWVTSHDYSNYTIVWGDTYRPRESWGITLMRAFVSNSVIKSCGVNQQFDSIKVGILSAR